MASASALSALASTVHAQEPSPTLTPTLDEIVIVATLLDTTGTPLSQVPTNAQILSAADIQRQNATNMANLLNSNLGAVSVSDGTGNPYQNDINYRGFQATSLLGAPVGLAVYFDGVRVNEPFGSIVNWDLIPMNALSSVQVQPGSNPIFGLNTLGGALLVNTRNGQDNPGLSLSALGGSFQRRAGSIEAGTADAATHTDYFLAGNYDKQDGFRYFSGSTVKQAFGKARWHSADERSLVELSGAWADTLLQGTQALPMDMLANPKAAYTAPDAIANTLHLGNLKASQQLSSNSLLSAQVYHRQSNTQSMNSNADLDDGCFNSDGSPSTGSLSTNASGLRCANATLNGSALNAVTGADALALGYERWTNTINASLVTSTTRQKTTGASLQWATTAPLAGHKNAFTFGLVFNRSTIAYRQDTFLARLLDYQTVVTPNRAYGFTANGLPPSSTNLPAFSGSNDLAAIALRSTLREANVYFTDTFAVTPQLSLTLAGSHDDTALDQAGANQQYLNDDGGYSWTDDITGVSYYNPNYLNAYRYANTAPGALATPNGIPSGAVAGPQTNSLDGVHRYQRFNPRLGFNYNFARTTGLFGAYSEAMRAPTSIELSCADPNHPCSLPTGFNGDPDLQAVTARSLELGARGHLSQANPLSWNAALYTSRLRNDIQFIATSATYGYFSNVGDTERRGIEFGAQANLDRLELAANYGYVQARYRSPFTTITGENVQSGNRIPGIPASTLKLHAAYPITRDFRLGATLMVVGEQYAHGNENNADPDGKLPRYTVVDLDAHYQIGALRLALNIDNLFNKTYSTYGLSGMTSLYTLVNQQFRTPAPPRGAWLKITYAFGGASERWNED
jgi:outer membrane receptor protein involved in Fe transport